MSVTKKELSSLISKKIGITKKQSLLIVKGFFNSISENPKNKVSINRLGTFLYKKTPRRVGRNPKTLESFEIKARNKLVFKPSEKIKRDIN